MNNKGQTGVWEGLIILILLISLGGIGYYEFTKKDTTQIFKGGAQSISPAPVVHFGGCAIIKEYIYANSTKATH